MYFAEDRRQAARLRRSYFIRLHRADDPLDGGTVHATTRDVSACGVYLRLRACGAACLRVGTRVRVALTVSHPPSTGGDPMQLDLRAAAVVVRVDATKTSSEEDAAGLALAFDGPLALREVPPMQLGRDVRRLDCTRSAQ